MLTISPTARRERMRRVQHDETAESRLLDHAKLNAHRRPLSVGTETRRTVNQEGAVKETDREPSPRSTRRMQHLLRLSNPLAGSFTWTAPHTFTNKCAEDARGSQSACRTSSCSDFSFIYL